MTSKYDRLGDHLAALDAPEITLTLAEVEAVVGPLPAIARREGSWWGRHRTARYSQAHAWYWQQAGYIAVRCDFVAGTVTFRRVAP